MGLELILIKRIMSALGITFPEVANPLNSNDSEDNTLAGLFTSIQDFTTNWVTDLTDNVVTPIISSFTDSIVDPVLTALDDYVVQPVLSNITQSLISSYKQVRDTTLAAAVGFYNRVVARAKGGNDVIWQ